MFLGVYIHIPFCKSICTYCDFCKIYYNEKYINKYLKSLRNEIKSRYKGEIVNSIYIGGGTPTCLSYEELKVLMDIIGIFNKSDDCEISIESNVESLNKEKIALLKNNGINRISLGVQSFSSFVLKTLGRNHNKEMVKRVIKDIKEYGINNINIDIIYGIIGDVSIVSNDINEFLSLEIPHISCYSLIIEDNTILGNVGYKNIDEDIEYNQYNIIHNMLSDKGYIQYEISNYSLDGYSSCHNINYWDNGNYYGFGVSGVSYLNNMRINNTKNMSKYLNMNYERVIINEDKDMQMSNTMILGLRKINGVNIKKFYDKFGEKIENVFNIDELIKDNKLVIDGDYIKINPQYIYLSNDIMVNFLERK